MRDEVKAKFVGMSARILKTACSSDRLTSAYLRNAERAATLAELPPEQAIRAWTWFGPIVVGCT